jgi:GntR family transcriptional repressor for pyruvate dehydrogenase complex
LRAAHILRRNWYDQLTTMPAYHYREHMLTAVTRRSLTEAVFERLTHGIFGGALAPGDRLPAERDLAVQLGVNRNAVREALQRLLQLRLVAIHPGGSTRVLDFRQSGGLDLLVSLLFAPDGELRLEAARSLIELRTALGPDIARRAAGRGGPARAEELTAALGRLTELPVDDVVARQRASLGLWRVLVAASDNLAYRLAFNTMEQAWAGIGDLVAPALRDELGDRRGYEAMVRAVVKGDGSGAHRAALQLVEQGERGLKRVLGPVPATKRRRGAT